MYINLSFTPSKTPYLNVIHAFLALLEDTRANSKITRIMLIFLNFVFQSWCNATKAKYIAYLKCVCENKSMKNLANNFKNNNYPDF